MRSMRLIVLAIALVLLGCGSRHEIETAKLAPIQEAKRFGAAITVREVTSLKALMAAPEKFVGQTLVVEGHVTGRCMGSGCWISLDTGNPDEPFYAKSVDHSFTFPEECQGRDVRVQGTFLVMNPDGGTGDSAQENEQGKDGNGAGHDCPKPIYFLNPTGLVIAP